jgi:hypothetical protein
MHEEIKRTDFSEDVFIVLTREDVARLAAEGKVSVTTRDLVIRRLTVITEEQYAPNPPDAKT